MHKSQMIFLSFCFLAVISIGFADSPAKENANDEMLIANVKQAWDAFSKKDAKAFDAIVPADVVDIEANGSIYSGSEVHQRMMDCAVTNPTLSDFKVYWIDDDAAFMTYKATYGGKCGAEIIPEGQVVATDLWVKKDGKWWGKLHQETPVAPPKP